MIQRTTIPLSRTKLFIAIVGCLIFVCVGWWLFSLSDTEILSQRRFNNPTFVHAIGLAGIVMAGAMIPWLIKKIFDKTPGLQFLEEGLVENTNMFSIGFIAWEDIRGFEVRHIQKQKILYVLLHDPEKYISRCGAIKRAILRFCMKLGPSPVTITSNSLRMNFSEVLELANSNLSRYKNA